MRVGILGSSDVAKSLGFGFLKEGHEVMLGSREPGKLASWVRESGKRRVQRNIFRGSEFGEVVLPMVNGTKSNPALVRVQA